MVGSILDFDVPVRRRIYLMRHGSVSYFDDEGRPIEPTSVSLNERGREQAAAAGRLFALQSIAFDKVVTSGLNRTVETARHVLDACTAATPAIEAWPELQEIRGGRLADLRDDELRDAFLGAFDGLPAEDARFLGGETIGELIDRVHPQIDRLRADGSWHTALLVLHGGVNRAVLSYALTGQRMLLGGLLQSPACINALDCGLDPRDWIVRYVNLCATDLLQPAERASTMEQLLEQYLKFRRSNG